MHVCDWTLEFGSNTDISNFKNSLGGDNPDSDPYRLYGDDRREGENMLLNNIVSIV